ncbi:hypothetical protein KXX48_000486, partial [Aspergillus fumigatus]
MASPVKCRVGQKGKIVERILNQLFYGPGDMDIAREWVQAGVRPGRERALSGCASQLALAPARPPVGDNPPCEARQTAAGEDQSNRDESGWKLPATECSVRRQRKLARGQRELSEPGESR